MNIPLAVVINLRRRPDRLNAFMAQWIAAEVPAALTVWPAVDWHDNTPTAAPWNRLHPGAWGCWRSHRDALATLPGPLLILEDDAMLPTTFGADLTALTVPEDWDLIYLGGEYPDPARPPQPVHLGLVRPQRIIRSHAYLTRDPATLAAQLADHETYLDYALDAAPVTRYAVDPLWVTQDPRAGSDIPTRRSEEFP